MSLPLRNRFGLVRSQGSIADLLKHGYTEADVGLDRLRETVQQRFANRTMRWLVLPYPGRDPVGFGGFGNR